MARLSQKTIVQILLGISRINAKKAVNLPAAFNEYTGITGHTAPH